MRPVRSSKRAKNGGGGWSLFEEDLYLHKGL